MVRRTGRVLDTTGTSESGNGIIPAARQVNLVIGHPKVHDLLRGQEIHGSERRFSMAEVVPRISLWVRVIEILLDEATAVHVLYFVQNPPWRRQSASSI